MEKINYKTTVKLTDKSEEVIDSEVKPIMRNIGSMIDIDFGPKRDRVLINERYIITILVNDLTQSEEV